MVEGGGSKDQAEARLWAYRDPASFQRLIDLLVETSVGYLLGQVKAGAGVLQIFDSWAGSLPEDEFARWCSYADPAPSSLGVKAKGARCADHRLSARCSGAGSPFVTRTETGIDAIGCDTSMPLVLDRETLQSRLARARQSRPATPARRRGAISTPALPRSSTRSAMAFHLQSRSRHSARHAASACRASGRSW